jgi:hypothetical protein
MLLTLKFEAATAFEEAKRASDYEASVAVAAMKHKAYVNELDDDLISYLTTLPLWIVQRVAADYAAKHRHGDGYPSYETVRPIVNEYLASR